MTMNVPPASSEIQNLESYVLAAYLQQKIERRPSGKS